MNVAPIIQTQASVLNQLVNGQQINAKPSLQDHVGTKMSVDQALSRQRAIELLQEAVRCDTVNGSGEEIALARILERHIALAGISVQVKDYGSGHANLLATLNGDLEGPTVVLSGHLDTVPLGNSEWDFASFGAEIHEGRMYGRGTADMKGGLIALLVAFLRMAEQPATARCGTVHFAATFGEEIGAQGALAMVSDGTLATFDAMIIAEPTANRIVVAHKGVLWLRIEAFGRTGHASMPRFGVNAVELLQEFSSRMATIPLPDSAANAFLSEATRTVTMFNGGRQVNVIPDHATMMVDVRTRPDQSHSDIIARLRAVAVDAREAFGEGEIQITPVVDLPAVQTDPEAWIVSIARHVVGRRLPEGEKLSGANYFTDGSAFVAVGGDILVLGPGGPEQAHQTNEFINVNDFLEAIEIYTDILTEIITTKDGENDAKETRGNADTSRSDVRLPRVKQS
jgi:succinyl-diaminopimelate desuccinylase